MARPATTTKIGPSARAGTLAMAPLRHQRKSYVWLTDLERAVLVADESTPRMPLVPELAPPATAPVAVVNAPIRSDRYRWQQRTGRAARGGSKGLDSQPALL